MKEKKLISAGLLLSRVTCLTVVMAGSSLSNNQTFNVVRSTSGEYTLIMNKDTLYPGYIYNSNGNRVRQYAIFQMNNPGNYAAINDYSYFLRTFGGEHLYTNTISEADKGIDFRIDITKMRALSYYFDSAKQRKIYTPGFSNGLNEIVMTLSNDNEIPFDKNIFRSGEKVTQKGNVVTITSISKTREDISLFNFTTTSDQVNKKIIIDQVVLRYTCESVN